MAFNWQYSASEQTVIKIDEWEEIRSNLDSLDNFINCSAKCTVNYTDQDSTIHTNEDSGYDGGFNNNIESNYNSSVHDNVDTNYHSSYVSIFASSFLGFQ